jgi:hypothetical protein
MNITYQKIIDAMDGDPYTMSLTSEAQTVIDAVNQGIDSRLEACNCPDRGDLYEPGTREIGGKVHTVTLECVVSPESLPVLIRRLAESCEEEAEMLASDMLTSLGIEVDTGCYEIVSPVDEEAPANV